MIMSVWICLYWFEWVLHRVWNTDFNIAAAMQLNDVFGWVTLVILMHLYIYIIYIMGVHQSYVCDHCNIAANKVLL